MEMRIDDALETGKVHEPILPSCLFGRRGDVVVGGCLFNVEFLADIKFLANLSGWQVLKSQILFFHTRKSDNSFPSPSSQLHQAEGHLS